jgi:hypothetical protein
MGAVSARPIRAVVERRGSLVSDHDLDSVPRDPVTTVAYQYTATARDAFRLCATFAQPAADDQHEYVSHTRIRGSDITASG